MNDRSEIVHALRSQLERLPTVHAMWIEGSLAEGDDDEYSDLDIWLSVDDDQLRAVYTDVEKALEIIAPIDFKLVLKRTGELGHNVYHLEKMSKFLTLDINTQKQSREVTLRSGIDIHEVIFDKTGVMKTSEKQPTPFDKQSELDDLMKYIDYMALSVEKNLLRGKPIESREYYRAILLRALEYLRKKSGISEKNDLGFKHTYKDIPRYEAAKLEEFYLADSTDAERIESLKSWLRSL